MRNKISSLRLSLSLTLQLMAVKFTVSSLEGENLLLYAGRFDFYSVQDGGFEDVQAGVDLVGHELLGFLHEIVNLACALVVHHHPVLAGLVHLGHHDGSLPPVLLVELDHLSVNIRLQLGLNSVPGLT